jgi:hypothetical protein
MNAPTALLPLLTVNAISWTLALTPIKEAALSEPTMQPASPAEFNQALAETLPGSK